MYLQDFTPCIEYIVLPTKDWVYICLAICLRYVILKTPEPGAPFEAFCNIGL